MSFCKKYSFLLALMLAVLLVFPIVSMANAQPDLLQPCSLTLVQKGHASGSPLFDIGFTVYRIAEAKLHGEGIQYTYTSDFAENGMPLDAAAEGFSEHLAAYARMNHAEGTVQTAQDDGKVRFSVLPAGMYLVVQHRPSAGYYASRPFVITLPMQTEGGSKWLYDVEAEPKTAPIPTLPQTMQLTVQKQWTDANAEDRPSSVEMVLCRDNIPTESVLLSEENGWTYTWTALDAAAVWSVVEHKVADAYTVRYEMNGQTVTVTNTRTVLPTPNPKPPLVQTGFRSSILLWTAAAGIVLLCVGAWFVGLKKKHDL